LVALRDTVGRRAKIAKSESFQTIRIAAIVANVGVLLVQIVRSRLKSRPERITIWA
jgi:hypothetical protein